MIERQKLISKIIRYKQVIASTKSPYLKRDYEKALKKAQKELKYYDMYQHKS